MVAVGERTPLKVTVIVPTYNTGKLIEPLVAAMRNQTMPAGDFEVLFVDDGSTDGTPGRLAELAAGDPLFRLIRLENTGWPGHPRNVAIDAARGEYVQFVDHDDSMGPEALERMYAMGRRNGSDIVIGKVTITHALRGAPQALMSRNRESVTHRTAALHDSLTVHKMYRTAFLRDQGIRFPVGPYVGEDLLFMVPAVFRAASVSIVGDYPCYYYLEREDGGHATPKQLDPVSYARNLREILDALLAETEPGPVRDTWLRRFWRADLVKYLSEPIFPAYPDGEYRDELLRALRSVAADYLTDGARAGLLGLERPRAELVRAGRTAELLELTRRAGGMAARAELTGSTWHRERLRLRFDAHFTYGPDGAPLTVVRRAGGRHLLHPELTEGLGLEPVDLTDELGRFRLDAFLVNRETAVKWMLPRDLDVVWEEVPGAGPGETGEPVGAAADADGDTDGDGDAVRVRPVIRATVAVDPRRAAGGRAPEAGEWEVQVRVLGPGLDRTTALVAGATGQEVPAAAVAGVRIGAAPTTAGAAVALVVAAGDGPALPSGPRVSVVLPVGEDPERLAASLASLAEQDAGEGAFEVLLAAGETRTVPGPLPAGVRLVQGDGDPRDLGAAAARGSYLFFLKPGDRLAPEALRRLYAYGLEHDADVVAGRLAGAQGRPVPKELYSVDRPDAGLARDPLGDSLTAEKLFDTEMVRRHRIRFAALPQPFAEQGFTVEALLRARRTAVLGSYLCCSYAPAAAPHDSPGPAAFFEGLREVMALTDRLTTPGAARDRLHRRWLRVEILNRIGGARLLDLDETGRAELLDEVRRTLVGHASATAAEGLPARQRLTLRLAAEGRTEELLELARWEQSVACRATLHAVAWREDGTLAVEFSAVPMASGVPLELVPGQERPAPSGLSPVLREAMAAGELTGAARSDRATAVLVLRERSTGARYSVETACEVRRVPVQEGEEGTGTDAAAGAETGVRAASCASATPGTDDGTATDHETAARTTPGTHHETAARGMPGAGHETAAHATPSTGHETVTVQDSAVLDPATVVSDRPLGDGAWDFHVRLTALGWTTSARLGHRKHPELLPVPEPRPHPDGGPRTVTPYWTKPQQDLSLRVAAPEPPPASSSTGRRLLSGLARKLRGGA